MKAVMVMFDSLNRHMLAPYGCDWIQTPSFQRLAERAVTFDQCYAGSLPCMPARRDLHTGRYSFLHRSWGPLEPFDDSMVELLRKDGVYTHLTTDHTHYFEDGGATYHTRYNSWEYARGQEGDAWKGQVRHPVIPESLSGPKVADLWRQDWVNRQYLDAEEKQPLAVTVRRGIEFMELNHAEDRWFLQIEAFDPHEPFFTKQKYKDLYPHPYTGKHFDWPDYAKVTQQPDEVQHAIFEYAALVSMCDAYVGRILDTFDRLDLWKDTMLIVNTDHGFLLGEHQWWGKNIQPFYQEIVHIPLFIWDPRSRLQGCRSDALVQTIDLPATLLEYFGVELPGSMQGKPIDERVLLSGGMKREGVLFGIHGGHVNVTDGRFVYMRGPAEAANRPLYEYTLMPTHMNRMFTPREFDGMEISGPLPFTKGCRLMKLPGSTYVNPYLYGSLLFDLHADPKQEQPLDDPETEARMIGLLAGLMRANDAPDEQFERLGIPQDGVVTAAEVADERTRRRQQTEISLGLGECWAGRSRQAYHALYCYAPEAMREQLPELLTAFLRDSERSIVIDEHTVFRFAEGLVEGGPALARMVKMAAQ
jgi:arylsulfatase A-like enzyme